MTSATNTPVPSPPFKVCIVIPCFNEEGVVTLTAQTLLGALDVLADIDLVTRESYVCCVDDGSSDGTWGEIESLAKAHHRIHGIKLSTNFGHPNALIAGLFTNRGNADILVTIDADLQDDVSVLRGMMEQHALGKRVVYGVRLERKVDPWAKRLAAKLFYRGMARMNHRTVPGHADFRSADSRVIADLERFGEANLYLRGLFPLIGYPDAEVHYVRLERHSGKSKYSYAKLASLAWQGITSFSTAPLRLVFYAGLAMSLLALAIGAWVLWSALRGSLIQGWASLALMLTVFSAISMISLGVIGEYIGKIYKEVKHRPRYIIESTTSDG